MKRYAEQLAFNGRSGYPGLAIDPDFAHCESAPSRRTGREPIEIGRPYRADQVSLCEMTKQPITDMGIGVPNLLLKKSTSVGCDRKASLDVISVFLRCVLFRITALSI